MAKRQSNGGGRKAPESDYQREMRKAFERSNKENQPVDNRSLVPQLMRELVEVHRYRGTLQQQQQQQEQQDAAMALPTSRKRRTPVPPRELPSLRSQTAQSGGSFHSGPRVADPERSRRDFEGTPSPKAKDVLRNHLTSLKRRKPAWEGRSLRSYLRASRRDSGNTFECIDATDMHSEDAENVEVPRQLSPDEQFELDLMLAIERSLEENFTPLASPSPDVQMPEKDEDIPHGEMTVKADVHQGGITPMKFVTGGQLPPKHPDLRPTTRQFPAESLYTVPLRNKNGGSTKIDRSVSPTSSSDSSSDRPPTPHPGSWVPFAMKYLEENSPQNIYQEEEFEDNKLQELQYMFSDEEQYELETQLAIQRLLEEVFTESNARSIGGQETMMHAGQEKQLNNYQSGMCHTGTPQPTHLSANTPITMSGQYAGSDDTVMVPSKGEQVTHNVPGTVCTSPPKPARLYVRGVNAPSSLVEPFASVVPRIRNVRCPPPSPTDEGWENILPLPSDGPEQDLTTEQQTNACCGNFVESFLHGINAVGRHLRLLGNYVWRYVCCCQPIQGTCASN